MLSGKFSGGNFKGTLSIDNIVGSGAQDFLGPESVTFKGASRIYTGIGGADIPWSVDL